MSSNDPIAEPLAHENPYTPADIISLLQQNHWLTTDPTPEQNAWADRAAQLLGHYAEDRPALTNLLRPIFHYDAAEILQPPQPRPLPSHPPSANRPSRRRQTRPRNPPSRRSLHAPLRHSGEIHQHPHPGILRCPRLRNVVAELQIGHR